MAEPGTPRLLRARFGVFELDLGAGELRKAGVRIALQEQQLQVLSLLLERSGELVTREQLRQRLWPGGTFVDFDHGMNAVINRLRETLGDSAESPRFIETLPRRGYRFVAPVELDRAHAVAIDAGPAARLTAADSGSRAGPQAGPSASTLTRVAIGVVAVAFIATVFAWKWSGQGTAVSQVSLAVLPFQNLGSDPEREYLADGLTSETGASIAQIDPERLTVKGRTLRYKGSQKSAAEIGRELSVDYLLESAVSTEGDRLRVTTTLLRVRDQVHVWSETYERKATSVLGLQQELSSAIAEQVRLRLSSARLSGIGRRQTQDAGAFDEYLKGRYQRDRRTARANVLAIEHFTRATAIDPDYSLAWAELAITYAGSAINGDTRPLDVWALARHAAAQAVRSNPNLAEAQLHAANVNMWLDWDWNAAETAFRRAIALDPSLASAHLTLGHLLSQRGRHDEAAAAMRRGNELDPLSPLTHFLTSQVAFQARHYPSAVEHARRTVLADSKLWIGYMQLAQVYERTGETDLALEALKDAARFSGRNSKAVALTGYVLAKAGRPIEAREVLKELEELARQRYVPPVRLGAGARRSSGARRGV